MSRRGGRRGGFIPAVALIMAGSALLPAAGAPAAPAAAPTAPTAPTGSRAAAQPPVQHLTVKVVSVRPHDATAYTQGLVWDHGRLYESAGLYGRSSLREVDPRTGAVLRQVAVPERYFAEGLAQVDSRLIQITWKEDTAFVYDVFSFQKVGEISYSGEGWGLCDDGKRLVMSDGSDRLTFRDRKSFTATGSVAVRLEGAPVFSLNELECVDGAVWANVWQSDRILRIDPASGRVTAMVEAGGLLSVEEKAHADVLNGIAWDPAARTFLITGKLWPKMFEVVFVPAK